MAYYALAIIGICVDNFNLAIFAFAISLLNTINFYAKPEATFYVWTHITLPIGISLLIFYIQYWYIACIILLMGMLYLLLMLLGKYAYYPAEVNIIQMLALAFSILIPPFLLISIPYFYVKAKQNLSLTIL